MTTITIALPEERLARLRDLAAESGLTAEEFLRLQVEHWLEQPETDFARATRYVLQKNEDLYRRLA